VWVFDPQGIAGERPTWWWNPLTYVTDVVKAKIMADNFAMSTRDVGSRGDAFFDGAGQTLLTGLLYAAALDNRYLTQVYLWLTDPTNEEPVEILRSNGHELVASSIAQIINAPEKQRGGIYGTAQQTASFLINPEAVAWIEPPRGISDGRPEFQPAEFVRSKGTLYSLSKEGQGSAGPIVTALTVAVCEAAEELAKASPGGRLTVPLVAVLDEAANVCRWRELPNLYSHYGSRGISMMTILQSWSQGVEVWGREGMRKLWSAANVKVYGGGVDEDEFLASLSSLVGDFESNQRSVSYGQGGSTNSYQARKERVLDVADLRAMPRGRAIALASGTPAVLMRTLPWYSGPDADAVKASIAKHDPSGGVAPAERVATI
jgi:type IV secretory pathway TraG/TraD family ATPase VirD4